MSDVAHDAPVAHHDEHESTGIGNRKLGMWVFLSSEFMFFGALISTYLLYSNRGGFEGTYPSEIYDIPFTSVSSFVIPTGMYELEDHRDESAANAGVVVTQAWSADGWVHELD